MSESGWIVPAQIGMNTAPMPEDVILSPHYEKIYEKSGVAQYVSRTFDGNCFLYSDMADGNRITVEREMFDGSQRFFVPFRVPGIEGGVACLTVDSPGLGITTPGKYRLAIDVDSAASTVVNRNAL